jgi:hypothetical protein
VSPAALVRFDGTCAGAPACAILEPPMAETPSSPPAASPRKSERECASVFIRSRPKVIFLYPTFFAALVAGIWTLVQMQQGVGLDQVSLTPGRIFWWTFAINLAAMAFDFTRGEFAALVLFFGAMTLRAHPHLFFLLALALGSVFVLVLVSGHFAYWEVTHNELLHHHGLLGNVERFPAPNLRMTKEIPDLFEYCLLGAGRLVLQPQGAARPIVLENVLFVDRLEARIQRLLAQLAVTIEPPHRGAP